MAAALKLLGQRFGRLLVTGRAENIGRRSAWHCVCDCGTAVVVTANNLVARVAKTTSCGCRRSETFITLQHRMRAAKASQDATKRESRLRGALVTAAAQTGKRVHRAPEPLSGSPKTWRGAAEAVGDLARIWR